MNNIKDIVESYIVADRNEKEAKVQKEQVRPVIIDEAKNKNEKTVTIDGITGKVLVSFKETISINPNKEFVDSYNAGKYPYIKKNISMQILPENFNRILSALISAGVESLVTINEEYEFDKTKKISSKEVEDSVLKNAIVVKENPSITVK